MIPQTRLLLRIQRATSIACFAAYSTQNLSLTTTAVEYTIDFDVESITNASFFTHSTTVDPEEITVLGSR
jgi:hypothetical protein